MLSETAVPSIASLGNLGEVDQIRSPVSILLILIQSRLNIILSFSFHSRLHVLIWLLLVILRQRIQSISPILLSNLSRMLRDYLSVKQVETCLTRTYSQQTVLISIWDQQYTLNLTNHGLNIHLLLLPIVKIRQSSRNSWIASFKRHENSCSTILFWLNHFAQLNKSMAVLFYHLYSITVIYGIKGIVYYEWCAEFPDI